MIYDPEIHHRRSIRMQGYDYSEAGAYFITICTQHRVPLFGNIADGIMRLNDAGAMIWRWYGERESKFPAIQCDAFVCMPNHIHFIVVKAGTDVGPDVGADLCVRPPSANRATTDGPVGPIPGEQMGPQEDEHIGPPLPRVVQWVKSMTTNAYIRGVKEHGWPPFPGKLWQRNYWEHIIRNETSLNHLREYIHNNPAQWESDSLHPDSPYPRNK